MLSIHHLRILCELLQCSPDQIGYPIYPMPSLPNDHPDDLSFLAPSESPSTNKEMPYDA